MLLLGLRRPQTETETEVRRMLLGFRRPQETETEVRPVVVSAITVLPRTSTPLTLSLTTPSLVCTMGSRCCRRRRTPSMMRPCYSRPACRLSGQSLGRIQQSRHVALRRFGDRCNSGPRGGAALALLGAASRRYIIGGFPGSRVLIEQLLLLLHQAAAAAAPPRDRVVTVTLVDGIFGDSLVGTAGWL